MDILKRTSKYEIRWDKKQNRCFVYWIKTKTLQEIPNRIFNNITTTNMIKLAVATYLGLG